MNKSTTVEGAMGVKSFCALPLFLTREMKYLSGAIMFSLAILLYLLSNHFHLSEPALLSQGWVDQITPFIPQTVWVYISEYIFFGVIYLLSRDMVNLNKYIYSFFFLQVVSVAIFFFWPTTYPRDLFPLPETLDSVTKFVFSTLRTTDSPANCLPSLHVSSVYLSSFIFRDEQKAKFPFFFTWATLIAISTLTTKQHYLVDVITGFGMAVLFYWFFHSKVSYRALHPKR